METLREVSTTKLSGFYPMIFNHVKWVRNFGIFLRPSCNRARGVSKLTVHLPKRFFWGGTREIDHSQRFRVYRQIRAHRLSTLYRLPEATGVQTRVFLRKSTPFIFFRLSGEPSDPTAFQLSGVFMVGEEGTMCLCHFLL